MGSGHLLPNEWYSPSTSPVVCPNFWSFFWWFWGGKLTRPSWRMVCWCFQMDLDVALLRLPRSSRPSHLSYHADDASLHGGRGRAADERLGAHLVKLGWIILPTKIALLLECRWHWQYHFSQWQFLKLSWNAYSLFRCSDSKKSSWKSKVRINISSWKMFLPSGKMGDFHSSIFVFFFEVCLRYVWCRFLSPYLWNQKIPSHYDPIKHII